ncbi:MAG: GNAT family N-acetyltransferase [Rhizomicrobium sp.]
MSCCRLETERLLLRPPEAGDIARIVPLLGDYAVARNLSRVPHPYGAEDAQSFISRAAEERALGQTHVFAIVPKSDGALAGTCGLHLKDDGVFEFGYWLGQPYWGRGLASEAARRLAAFAFHDLDAPTLRAGWFHDNPASGHVLDKLGAVPAGVEHRDCLARGHAVYCHMVVLDRENFRRRQRKPGP